MNLHFSTIVFSALSVVAICCCVLCGMTICATSASAAEFSEFIAGIESAPFQDRRALVDSFMAALPAGAAPLVEGERATFIHRGVARSVKIAGDMTDWSPDIVMNHVPGTDFWWFSLDLPADARVDYKIVVDDSHWVLDPLNPNTMRGGFGPNSELAMPAYEQPPEIREYDFPQCLHVTFDSVHSPQLGNSRTVKVLMPPGSKPDDAPEYLLVHDGLEYITLAHLDRVLAYLANEYPEMTLPICVCVPPVERTAEYAGANQAAFGEFIVETLMPLVESRHGASDEPWGSMGASNGGNISLYLAGRYPERFAKIAAMSPYIAPEVHDAITVRNLGDVRIYLNWGTYDLAKLMPGIDRFETLLDDRAGIVNSKRVYNEGHSWGLWRATIDEALKHLYR